MSEDPTQPNLTRPDPTQPVIQVSPPTFGTGLIYSAVTLLIYLSLTVAAVARGWVRAMWTPGGFLGLTVFAAICYGLTTIVVFSAISWPWKMALSKIPGIGHWIYEWDEPEPRGLLACPLCTATWAGTILATFGITAFPVSSVFGLVAHGLLGAGSTWLMYGVAKKLGIND